MQQRGVRRGRVHHPDLQQPARRHHGERAGSRRPAERAQPRPLRPRLQEHLARDLSWTRASASGHAGSSDGHPEVRPPPAAVRRADAVRRVGRRVRAHPGARRTRPGRSSAGRRTPDSVAAKRAELGLDQPLLEQYWDWLSGLLTGDPGVSFTNGVPVIDVLGDRIWNSLFLMAIGAAVSIPISIVDRRLRRRPPGQGVRLGDARRRASSSPRCPSSSSGCC